MNTHAPIADLVLMAGQSNMLGYRTDLSSLPPHLRGPLAGAQVWVEGTWRDLEGGAGYQRQGFGPELGFAEHWHQQTGRLLRIVKQARSGSSLLKDWTAEGSGGRLYTKLVKKARAAMAMGPARVRGLLWMQGETEAKTEGDASQYRAAFEAFVARLRLDLGIMDLPVVAAQVFPPKDQFPAQAIVRRALKNADLSIYARTDVRDLEMQGDALHLTGPSLHRLGTRFAERLLHLDQARTDHPMVRQWLYNSEQYHVWYEGPSQRPEQVVVAFPHANDGDGFEETGFGQPFFRKRNIAAVYIRSRQSNWFQDEEIFLIAQKIRAFLGQETTIVTYGASMGGHGALLLSGPLQAKRVLTISPQYAIDREIVPFETRWKKHAKRIGRFKHRIDDHISPSADKIVVYDPLNIDRKQIEMFSMDSTWRLAKIPLASHQAAQRLLESGTLPLLLEDLFDDGPDLQKIRDLTKARREDSKIYWLTLANTWAERNPALAIYAIDRCIATGGPKRKLNRMRDTLSARVTS